MLETNCLAVPSGVARRGGPGRQSGGATTMGMIRGIRQLTTFGGGKIAVHPGRR